MNQGLKYHIKTYGCQMNDLDSLQMGRLLKQEGYQLTQNPEEAQVLLINTCSIREKPHLKLYSDVGRFRSLKLKNPDLILGITGCQAQAEGPHLQKRFPYLDLVLGPDQVAKLPNLVSDLRSKKQSRVSEVAFEKNIDYRFLNLLPDEEESGVKAFVTIQKGCDNFCSFCIVPYVRGREVCREADEIV
ncbi:MAG: tRNA (N6-isopentenyl adenosine(37)-C2)-methylthiotransferase MiaB, partial [Deltaproteobacteria bacterium]|nr:tRNA (N6-isopentenyl adenosine(37)-C2)-methylthiotransferase MiaB [Deltaproteobacteria bacterium]